MAFTPQEQKIILYGKTNGKTKEQVKEAILKYRSGYRPPAKETEPVETEIDTSGQPSQLMEATGIPTVKRIGEGLKERVENVKESFARQESFPGAGDGQTALETGLQTAGQVVGAVTDVAAGVAGGVFRTALSPQTRAKILGNPTIQEGLQLAGEGMEVYEAWKAKNPRLAGDLEAVVNIGSIIPVGKGAQLGVRGVKGAVRAGEAVVEGGAKLARTGLETAEKAVQAGKGAIETVGDVTRGVTQGVKDITRRIPVNLEAKRTTEQAIRALPTETAQTAVRDGVDIKHVRELSNIAKTTDPEVKDVIKTALKVDAGEATADDVIEKVGRRMVQTLDQKKKEVSKIGAKLGEEVKKLGVLTQEELVPTVLARLKRTSGLEGLEIKDGVLSFKNTTLSTQKATQKEIQKFFSKATKWGKGESKDRLRREIFEILGGKKKGLSDITETGDKALEAIRGGLLDTLGTKNPMYKKLTTQFAKMTDPIRRLSKKLKLEGEMDIADDLRNLDAGLLARRITSNAGSNAEIQAILRSLGIDESTKRLQDVYNVLNRYLDIEGGTTIKGLIAPEVSLSPTEIAGKAIKGVAGATKDVQREALKKLLQDLFPD